MTATPGGLQHPARLVQPFPEPGPLVRLAYRELGIAATGTTEQVNALGDTRLLPRPWDPPTCRNPELREQLWAWLDAVVTWLNTEYVWDVTGMIPACWPLHPHLIHDIAVLADQRRSAGTALSSDAMEEWHRYALPAFIDRMRTRLANHCEDGHRPWPATGRHTRHTNHSSQAARAAQWASDIRSSTVRATDRPLRHTPVLGTVHPDTGELTDT